MSTGKIEDSKNALTSTQTRPRKYQAGKRYTPFDLSKAKEWFMNNFRKSSVYTRVYARSLPEILKALRVNQAFQKELDNPAAHKALQDPALKPLLDQASD